MELNSVWQFATAGSIKFGRGARWQLSDVLNRHAVAKPLVVTDGNLTQLPLIEQWLGWLGERHPQTVVFDGCQAEPAIEVAVAACRLAVDVQADAVIGLGGGSNLDVAKITAAVARHGGSPADYFGFDRIPGPILPNFALPTTAGTGSEVSHSAVLTDTQQQIKVSTLSGWMRPTLALVDPALSDSCPQTVTAHSGIDALVHAVEAYTNRHFSEMVGVDPQARAYEGSYRLTRVLAAEAIRLIGGALPVVCRQPDHLAARDDMALAAMLAGMAFSNSGVGIVHALEYPIGALTHVSHGEGNGLLLPHVMRYNLPVRLPEFAEIATWLGKDVSGLSGREAAEATVEAVVGLQHEIGIRTTLSELGLPRAAVGQVAAKALEIRRLMALNPQTPTLVDLENILLAAY